MKIRLFILCLVLAYSFQQASFSFKQYVPRNSQLSHAQPLPYYQKILNNLDPEAKCLDGTPGLLYVHQGGDTKNFVIFFEGGGLCGEETLAKTLESCYQRSKTLLGSSTPWPERIIGQGYLSVDPAVSKFANWTKFIFGYCDGSLHQGLSAEPLKYKDAQLYFRGASITRSHFNWIHSKYNLKSADRIILTGGSAGGIAVHLWNNYMRKFVKNPDSIYAIDDSGVFMNVKTTLGDTRIQKLVSNTYKVANINESTPFTECNALHKSQEWKCLFIEYGSSALNGKFLVINSEYDSWAIPNILQVKCLKNAVVGGQTLSSCSSKEITHIESYRSAYKDAMTKLMTANPSASIWSIACANHVYACLNVFYNSDFQRVPEIVGNTVKAAVQRFVLGNERVVSYDIEAWPANKGCAK